MEPSGHYSPMVCHECGDKIPVTRKGFRRAIIEHVIENHMLRPKVWAQKFTCWCGLEVSGYDALFKIRDHLNNVTDDCAMIFPESVDRLWAHYHASLIGAKP